MIVLGLVLLVIGLLTGIGLLFWIGVVLVTVGGVFALAGGAGRPVGGRRHWY